MGKHTAGRWQLNQVASGYNIEICRDRLGVPRAVRLARVGGELTDDKQVKKQAYANALLMCTAPLLLEAVKRFLKSSACKNGCRPEDMTCDTQFARAVVRLATRR
jgi:hypothetical protein